MPPSDGLPVGPFEGAEATADVAGAKDGTLAVTEAPLGEVEAYFVLGIPVGAFAIKAGEGLSVGEFGRLVGKLLGSDEF